MFKKENGVTMLALAIVIVVLLILAGVSVRTGFAVVRDFRIGKVLSNMTMVQAKMETIYEDYEFNGKNLEGTEENYSFTLSATESSKIASGGTWYKWDQYVLNKVGLDPSMIEEDTCFYVNYETNEILYSVGTKYKGEVYHSLTALKEAYNSENT